MKETAPMNKIADEALQLTARWYKALQALQDSYGDPKLDRAEQEAFDELVEWIEAHDLNYTRLDPRGPRPNGQFDPLPQGMEVADGGI